MKLIKNKKGIGLPTMLAIVTFIIGTAASLLSITFSQTKLVEQNIENSEAYQNAVYNVDAAVRVVIRELINDNTYLDNEQNIFELEDYFNVVITQHQTISSLWEVTSSVTDTRNVTSYISTVTGSAMTMEEATNLLTYLSRFISGDSKSLPDEVLSEVLPSYFEIYEVDQTSPPKPNDLESVKKITQYISKSTDFIPITQSLLNMNNIMDGNFIRKGNLTIYSGNTLHIADGRILFVEGSLTMQANSHLIGNVVVFGDVIFQGNASTQSTFIGTLFVGNHFTSNTKIVAGTEERPSFVFSTLHNNIYRQISGNIFFTGTKFTYDVTGVTSTIYGGVYVDDYNDRGGELIIISTDIRLFYDLFETYALPYDSSIVTDGSYTYTNPK
ncbi:MAG: hypothetical protein EP317_05400 [Bacillota bacterium]|nr:MAG: hypothetical protein EP317_05400 [Bacillota bacterium]